MNKQQFAIFNIVCRKLIARRWGAWLESDSLNIIDTQAVWAAIQSHQTRKVLL